MAGEDASMKSVEIVQVDVSKLVDADGNSVDLKSASKLRRWLIERYDGREVEVADNGEIVRFAKKELQASIKKRGDAHNQLYADLDNLLRNSVYYGYDAGDARHPWVGRQDIYYALARIGDKDFGVRFKVDVQKNSGDGIYKDHKVVRIGDVDIEEIDTKKTPSPYAGFSPAGTKGGAIPIPEIVRAFGSTNKIQQPAQKVNSKGEKISSPQNPRPPRTPAASF